MDQIFLILNTNTPFSYADNFSPDQIKRKILHNVSGPIKLIFVDRSETEPNYDQGRQFDKDGNLQEWWNNATISRFRKQVSQSLYRDCSPKNQYLTVRQLVLNIQVSCKMALYIAYCLFKCLSVSIGFHGRICLTHFQNTTEKHIHFNRQYTLNRAPFYMRPIY